MIMKDFTRISNVCSIFKVTDTEKIEFKNNKTTTASVLKRLSWFFTSFKGFKMSEIIRILPMDKKGEFCNANIDYIQNEFFIKDLPSRFDDRGEGKYCYKKYGMKIDKDTLVLFQYDNMIVAIARLENIKKFDTPQDWYHGTYYFKPESIKIFKPINNNLLNKIFNINIKFSNTKHTIETNNIQDFDNLKDIKTMDKTIEKYNLIECKKKSCSC